MEVIANLNKSCDSKIQLL